MDFAVPETWPDAQGGGFRWEGWEVWPGGGGAGPDPFSLSLQDAMRKTLDPKALALGKELGLWSTLSEAAATHRTLPTPVLSHCHSLPSSLGDLQDSSSLSQPCHTSLMT